MNCVTERNIQYETYYNGRFDYAVKYPSNIFTPQPPPTNRDGRKFVSSEEDIEMVVTGFNQSRRSLEQLYRDALEAQRERGAEVTYDYLGDDEFIISGYSPSGKVFYSKTLLRHDDFIGLNLNYDSDLQPEFDSVVAEISNSLRSIRNERQIAIYFPKQDLEPGDGLGAVEPVLRTTDRIDVAEFSLEQLLQGPTEAEQYFVSSLPIELTGESVCWNNNFTVAIEDSTAVVQFCREVQQGGLGDSVALENAIQETLKQFSTVNQVVLLNKDGNCLVDFEGANDCLEKLPESVR